MALFDKTLEQRAQSTIAEIAVSIETVGPFQPSAEGCALATSRYRHCRRYNDLQPCPVVSDMDPLFSPASLYEN
ncbi:hypothetical protein [Sphingomonas sp. Leaf62]|uniref:hypothetical protein n=1 Tax=Sphingomonas sp. Leaf62 TaxID=1736228 RepID=UPI000A7B9F70|nr:hypothetical protein [Sphingomonas sp. Leaf62]